MAHRRAHHGQANAGPPTRTPRFPRQGFNALRDGLGHLPAVDTRAYSSCAPRGRSR